MSICLFHLLLQDPGLFIVSSKKNRKLTLRSGKPVERQRLPLHDAVQGSILVRQFLSEETREY
jgi:hypothetical protein